METNSTTISTQFHRRVDEALRLGGGGDVAAASCEIPVGHVLFPLPCAAART